MQEPHRSVLGMTEGIHLLLTAALFEREGRVGRFGVWVGHRSAVTLSLPTSCHEEMVKTFSFALDSQDSRTLLWDTRCPKPATRIGMFLCTVALVSEALWKETHCFMPDFSVSNCKSGTGQKSLLKAKEFQRYHTSPISF